MKFFTYCLTSSQLPPQLPALMDHYYFTDPVNGLNFSYPSTAAGCEWPPVTCTYTATADGGMFFPWGYQVFTETRKITLKDFKGDTSITFQPSCLDVTYHDVFKIVYDFGDGETRNVERQIVSQIALSSLNLFINNDEPDSPTNIPVTHVFRASSEMLTYTPHITVFYGDMTLVYFDFNFDVYPNSVYEIDNVHLINSIQLPKISGADLNIVEVASKSVITNIILNPNGNS